MLEPSAAAASTRLIIKQRKGGTGASPVPMAGGSWGSYEVPGGSGGGESGEFWGVIYGSWGFRELYGVSGSSMGFLGVLGVLKGFLRVLGVL